jgi:hypothetical protein
VAGSEFTNCLFGRCEFERLDFDEPESCRADRPVIEADCVIRSIGVAKATESLDVYDPKKIIRILAGKGLVEKVETGLAQGTAITGEAAAEQDEKLAILQKAILAFNRSTFVSPGAFKQRLSINAARFFDEIVPELKAYGVLQQVNKGPGKDRLKLGIPLNSIASAIAESNGSYDRCLEQLRSYKSNP